MGKNIIRENIDKIFYTITKRKSKKQYLKNIKELEKNGANLTKKDKAIIRHKIVEKNAKKAKSKAVRRGFVVGVAGILTLAFVGGYKANDAINPPVEGVKYDNLGNTEINLDEIEGELQLTGDKTKEFRKQQARETITDISREKAQEEIENANNPQDVLRIVKEAVTKYWEESYGEDVNNVTMKKITEHVNIYRDTAQNGDEIQRFGRKGNHSNTILIVDIDTDDGKYTENLLAEHGGYTRVYGSNEEVEKAESSKLEECAPFILEGLEYYIAMEQNNKFNVYGQKLTSDIQLREYKNDFYAALAKGYDTISQIQIFGGSQESPEEIVGEEKDY